MNGEEVGEEEGGTEEQDREGRGGEQRGTAEHSRGRHRRAKHSTAQHSAAQHSTAQHSTALHRQTKGANSSGITAEWLARGANPSGITSFWRLPDPSCGKISDFGFLRSRRNSCGNIMAFDKNVKKNYRIIIFAMRRGRNSSGIMVIFYQIAKNHREL